MTAHLYYFKWPLIQEGLVHKEISVWDVILEAPVGAWIFTDQWLRRLRPQGMYATVPVPPEKVPKLIRAHLLLIQ